MDAPTPTPIPVHNGACLSISADIDPDAFLSGGDDGKLVRISAAGATETLAEFKGKWIEHVTAHSGAGARVYAIGKDAYVLDRKSKGDARKLSHATSVGGLAINPKGKRLAVAHYNGVTLWWLAAQDSKPQTLEWKGSHLSAIWSPDGDYVVTEMQENALHGWRLSTSQHMRMQGYGAKVRSLELHGKARPRACDRRRRHGDLLALSPGSGPMGKALPAGVRRRRLAAEATERRVTAVACQSET